jgi:hypothetical protein
VKVQVWRRRNYLFYKEVNLSFVHKKESKFLEFSSFRCIFAEENKNRVQMTDVRPRYPLGMQVFSELREGNFLYVDKTELIYKLTHGDAKFTFLSRPRRFGKSLLTRTLECYFQGRRELFTGLAMEKLEKEWTEHPVLRFDFGNVKGYDMSSLTRKISRRLAEYEAIYGRDSEDVTLGDRFYGLIQSAYKQTGQKVKNITNDNEYVSICGITLPELKDNFEYGIRKFAEQEGCSTEKMVDKLREQYDGYHFTDAMIDVFNPYSLLNAFSDCRLNSYWFQTGTPTLAINMLKAHKEDWAFNMENIEALPPVSLEDFSIPLEDATDPIPVLYQAG